MTTRPWVRYGLILFISLLNFGVTSPGRAAPLAAPARQTLPPVFIYDEDFQPADWTATAEIFGEASYTVTQQLTGGHGSPPFRFMSHTLPPVSAGLSTIYVTHVYTAYTYDPGVQGPITAIDYSESGIILSYPFTDTISTTQPVVVQDGRVFRSPRFLRFIASGFDHNWETKSQLQLTAADFFPPGGSEGDNPDFSASGSPIQFGFTRTNSRGSTLPPVPADQDLVIEQGVDNWQLIVYRAPENIPNRPPQAVDDIFILNGENRTLPIFEFFDVVGNDSDPDQDFLDITGVSAPLYGSAGEFSAHSVVYQLDEARGSDSFSYTISDDEYTDSAQVDVYIDCACVVLCLNGLELPEPTPFPSAAAAADSIDLPLIYGVRDHVLKTTPDGRRYVDMYYTRNPEILINLLTSEPLRTEAVAAVELWQPNLSSLVDGDGSALITQAQVDALETFLANLSAASSPELQGIIADELTRLGPLDDYVGLSMLAARTKAIGDPTLYLPLVVAP